MSVEAKNDRWVDLWPGPGSSTHFRVTFVTVDLGDEAHTLVDTLSFEVAPDRDYALGRPASRIAVEDLKEARAFGRGGA